ncbi:MAG: Pacifastin inhibitor [Labilithrix sp.]|nr:Pacifastin inhibitor [Labilithrix sp.]
MLRALVVVVAVVLALAACHGKSDEISPSAAASASAAAAAVAAGEAGLSPPAGIARKLCTDGLHRAGEHWKNDCNPCRCGADGEIVCTQFVCPPIVPREAGGADGGTSGAIDAGPKTDGAKRDASPP